MSNTPYTFSEALQAFFTKVTNDPVLQQRLYETKELCEVASIGQELGFKITSAEILRAQAGRILSLPHQQQEIVALGDKPTSGAQWGRGGKGYLDNAGYWLVKFVKWGYIHSTFEQQLAPVLAKITTDETLQEKLLGAKTYREIAGLMNQYGYRIVEVILLQHQAEQILKLDDTKAEQVASGTIFS